jgi:hypothetical protein
MAVFEITDNDTGFVFEIEGEREPTPEEIRGLIDGMDSPGEDAQEPVNVPPQGQEPSSPILDNPLIKSARGSFDLAESVLESGVRKSVSGLEGLRAAVFDEEGAALKAVQDIQGGQAPLSQEGQQVAETLGGVAQDVGKFVGDVTPQPVKDLVGDVVDFTGKGVDVVKEGRNKALNFINEKFGPGSATAIDLVTDPEAIIEIAVGLGPAKRLLNIAPTKADDIIDNTNDALRQDGIRSAKTELPPEIKDYETLVDDIKKGREEKVARQVLPDQEILDSAERLGVDLNPSHYSTSRAFKEVEQSIKSTAPGSRLADIEEKAIVATGKSADDLILDLSGDTDKSLTDFKVKNDVEKNIALLASQSEKAYGVVNKNIPRPTKVIPGDSKNYIEQRLEDLGGDEALLTAAEKQLKRLTDPGSNPTYGALDQVRRSVGDALGKNQGPFKDDDRGILDQVYGVLSNDQQGVADFAGVGREYALGRKLVFGRKNLEKKAVDLFGKEMNDSILPKLKTAAGKLTKGDVSQLNKLMNAVPPARRAEVSATMLNEIFTLGSSTGRDLGSGFVNAFASLNRNKGAKDVLFKHLPQESRRRFNDIGRVATGIFNSKAFQNNSRTAIGNSLVRAMDDGTFTGKIFSKAGDIAIGTGVGALAGSPLAGVAASTVLTLVKKSSASKIQAGDALLTSPGFKRSVQDALDGNMGISNSFMNTKVFKNWLKGKPKDARDTILAIGFVPWLLDDNSNE